MRYHTRSGRPIINYDGNETDRMRVHSNAPALHSELSRQQSKQTNSEVGNKRTNKLFIYEKSTHTVDPDAVSTMGLLLWQYRLLKIVGQTSWIELKIKYPFFSLAFLPTRRAARNTLSHLPSSVDFLAFMVCSFICRTICFAHFVFHVPCCLPVCMHNK